MDCTRHFWKNILWAPCTAALLVISACGGGGGGGADTTTVQAEAAPLPPAPPPAQALAPILNNERARLGQLIFNDPDLSEPRGTACAACHQPNQGFAGNNGSRIGVARGSLPSSLGLRNSMTNSYQGFVPSFGFQTENGETEAIGGHFWDGRVDTLAQQALSQTKLISGDVLGSIEGMIAEIDKKLSEQVNTILHHNDFQKLESAWRGLHYMVMNTSTGKDLKIRVLNIGKDECYKMFRQYRDAAWDQSPLFKKIYEAWKKFRDEQLQWFSVAENRFDNFMQAARSASAKARKPL